MPLYQQVGGYDEIGTEDTEFGHGGIRSPGAFGERRMARPFEA